MLYLIFSIDERKIIESYQPLAEWFEENSRELSYTGVERPQYEVYTHTQNHLQVLGMMLNYALAWIQSEEDYTNQEKAIYASIAINYFYRHYLHILVGIPNCKKYDIEINNFDFNIDDSMVYTALHPKIISDSKLEALEKRKIALMAELEAIDAEIIDTKRKKKNS